ncbi:hypothetical protein Hanom_Chr11g01019231 [Helianthus anomalus]
MCFPAQRNMKYDFKRGCYIDTNLNPLDLVKIFCAGTFRTKEEEASKVEESVKFGSSSSKSVCSKCDSFKTENDKLVKDAESLTLEVKKLNDKKQADDKQILFLQGDCDKLKDENDKLLSNLNSLTLENKKLKENAKNFQDKIKVFENVKVKMEKDFQSQIKIFEDGRNVFSKNNIEKQKMINSHLKKIIRLEKESECAQKKIKELEEKVKAKKKSSENEDFWIKLENKNLKANETKFQEQIKVLENEKSVLENLKSENGKTIKSHLERISQLEKEAENSRAKINELEKKLKGFVTSFESLNIPCPKPINSVPISDNVKVEDCDDKTDDEGWGSATKSIFPKKCTKS